MFFYLKNDLGSWHRRTIEPPDQLQVLHPEQANQAQDVTGHVSHVLPLQLQKRSAGSYCQAHLTVFIKLLH